MIHYIQPYRPDKNIGRAINEAITLLRASRDDWIVLLDHDVLFLRPDSKEQLETILNATEYDLLCPVTNRLGQDYQLVQGMFSVTDIREHIDTANRMHTLNYGVALPTINILPAFCLCFRISTWSQIGYFHENTIQFDSLFSIRAIKLGFKLAIMPGIYVFHLYRMWSDNPVQYIKHLLPQ